METYYVKLLSALVKVVRRAEDGTALMRHRGFDGATGKAVLEPATKNVLVKKGQPLPDDVADGEVDRLLANDPPAIGRKATVSVMAAPAAAKPKTEKTAKKPAAAPRARKPAAKKTAAAKAVQVDLGKLAELGDDELANAIASTGVKKLVAAVGTDVELAQRVLAAEKTASAGDPRSSLVGPLEKLVNAGSSS